MVGYLSELPLHHCLNDSYIIAKQSIIYIFFIGVKNTTEKKHLWLRLTNAYTLLNSKVHVNGENLQKKILVLPCWKNIVYISQKRTNQTMMINWIVGANLHHSHHQRHQRKTGRLLKFTFVSMIVQSHNHPKMQPN